MSGQVIGIASLVGLPIFIFILVKAGVIESPGKTKARKWREADEALTAKEEYDSLPPQAKLLYKMNQNLESINHHVRALYFFIIWGAIISAAISLLFMVSSR